MKTIQVLDIERKNNNYTGILVTPGNLIVGGIIKENGPLYLAF